MLRSLHASRAFPVARWLVGQRYASVSASQLRAGNLVAGSSVSGQPAEKMFIVEDFTKGKAGKGAGFVQVKFRLFPGEGHVQQKFWSDEKVELIELDPTQTFTYLYSDADTMHLMDMDTGEQIEAPTDILGKQAKWLDDGMQLRVQSYQGKPILGRLPDQVAFEVTEAPPSTRQGKSGDTHKTVTLENGVRIRAPAFIQAGERILIKTETDEYVGRSSN